MWPGTGLEQYPVTRIKELNWFYIYWRQQNTVVKGSHCATAIPAAGARHGKGRQRGLQHAITTSKRIVPLCNHFPPAWQWVALGNDSCGIPWLHWPLSSPELWRVHHSKKMAEESSTQLQLRLFLVSRENRRDKLTSCPRKFCPHHCGGKIQFYQHCWESVQ